MASRYIKDLYRTDAQASGFLVMACYNWGENHILPLIQKMPPNPRQRNFWQLLEKFRESIPAETYDYVSTLQRPPQLVKIPDYSVLTSITRF